MKSVTSWIPFTATMMSVFGLRLGDIAYESKMNRVIHVWRQILTRFMIQGILVASVLLSAYIIVSSDKMETRFSVLFKVAIFISALILYHVVSCAINEFSDNLDPVMMKLYDDDLQRIKSHDKLSFIWRIVVASAPGIVMISLVPIMIDRMIKTFNDFSGSLLELFFQFSCFTVSITSTLCICHFYSIICRLSRVFAERTKMEIREASLIIRPDETTFSSIQQQLKDLYIFIRRVNELLGVIPLTMFAQMFTHLVLGLAFITSKVKMGFGILMISVGGEIFTLILVMIDILRDAEKMTHVVSEAASIAGMISQRKLPKTAPENVKESRRSLTVFLDQESNSVFFTAMSYFTLEPSIILSFMNAVVPFSVMVITTINHVSGEEANLSPSCNCTLH